MMAEDSSQIVGQELNTDEHINAEQIENAQDEVDRECEEDLGDAHEVEASFFIIDVDKEDKRETAGFVPAFEGAGQPSIHALDVGFGDLTDPRTERRVDPDTGRRVYIGITAKRGNIKIYKVTPNNFIFGTNEATSRYITASDRGGRWRVLWMTGSDPGNVNENNMSTDKRVWEVFYKSHNYYIRLERDNRRYLHAHDERLSIFSVNDPENPRDVTPLSVRSA